MPNYKKPSPEQVRALLARIGSLPLRRAFYEDLDNPEWVEPLHTQKAFANPPEPQVESDGTVRESLWPEIDYLVKSAEIVPEQVVTVALGLTKSNNSWVRRGVIQIAAKVPANQAARLVPALISWAPELGFRTNPEDMVTTIVNLLKNGQLKLGRQLATAVFRPLSPDPSPSQRFREPQTALDAYSYRRSLPLVAEALGVAGLNQVVGWLEVYERAAGNFSPEKKSDLTSLGRPVIRTSTRQGREIENSLIDALRALGTETFKTNPARAVDAFTRPGMTITTKLLLSTGAEALRTTESTEQARLLERLTPLLGTAEFAKHDYQPEFAELAEAISDASSPEALSGLVPTLEIGPLGSREALAKRLSSDEDDPDEVEARTNEYLLRWQQRLLASIGAHALPADLSTRLTELDSRFGKLENPKRSDFEVTTWVGPTSPLASEAMSQLTPNELLAHLKSWHPEAESWDRPSHEGQGRTLRGLLAENPHAVQVPEGELHKLRPLYIRAILEGWSDALKKDIDLPWSTVEDLALFVLEHDDESPFPKEGRDFDDDGDFVAAKGAAINLLEIAASGEPAKATDGRSSLILRLAPLIVDASRDTSTLERYLTGGGESTDPLNLSLNERLPELTRLLIYLTKWDDYGKEGSPVLEALDRLVGLRDPRGAIPAVLGESVGRLYNYALPWLQARRTLIFGDRAEQIRAQQIALSTALATQSPHALLLDLLRESINAAIANPEEIAIGWASAESPGRLMGDWLVTCMISGVISANDELYTAYFSSAPPEIRAEVVGHVGSALMHTESPSPAILERARTFWDSRRAHVEEHPEDAAELREFYWFIGSEKFNSAWWLPRLRYLVELMPDLPTHGMLGEHLAAAARLDPDTTLEIVQRLVDGHATDRAYLAYDLIETAVPQTLASAFDTGETELAARASRLMNQLGEEGYIRLEERVNALRKSAQ